MKSILITLAVGLAQTMLLMAQTSQKLELSIGDPMPEFTYSKWIKGEPITNFDDDKVYIFEFWATWCGPCIAAMPHLSEVAKQYAGKAEVIGVNVWERVGDKPYESSLPAVEKFVNASGDRMGFHVVADNNDLDIVNNWLKPAAINGIPSTFIVKNKTIQWIGHPHFMDSVLATIVDGTHDMMAFKKEYEERKLKSMGEQAVITAAFEEAQEAGKAGDLERAFHALDNLASSKPTYAFAANMTKFNLLLEHRDEAEMLGFYNEHLAENRQGGYILADALLKSSKTFSPETYAYAYEAMSGMTDKMSALEEMRADVLARKGDYAGAVKHMEEAVRLGGEELKNPRFEGRIFPHTVDEYREKLAEYRRLSK